MNTFELQEYHIDWIESFLLNRLDEREHQQFLQLLEQYPALQEELEIRQELFLGLKELGPEQHIELEKYRLPSAEKPLWKKAALILMLVSSMLFLGQVDLSTSGGNQLALSPEKSTTTESRSQMKQLFDGDLSFQTRAEIMDLELKTSWRQSFPFQSLSAQDV